MRDKGLIVFICFFGSLIALGAIVGNNGAGVVLTTLYGVIGTIWYIGTYMWG